jgi:hypothetical protein
MTALVRGIDAIFSQVDEEQAGGGSSSAHDDSAPR